MKSYLKHAALYALS